MKNLLFLVVLCLLLAGCQEQSGNQQPDTAPVEPAEPAPVYPPPGFKYTPVIQTVTKTTSESIVESVLAHYDTDIPLSKVDYASCEDEMSEEDWEAFTRFFPLLKEGKTLLDTTFPDAPEEVTLYDLLPTDGLEDPPDEFMFSYITLLDMTGDGQKELVLGTSFRCGWDYVIHREDDAFYCVVKAGRCFDPLQVNGVYYGSGGATHGYYLRLHFDNGTLWEELLAERENDTYTIDGRELSDQELKNVLGDGAEREHAYSYSVRAVQE